MLLEIQTNFIFEQFLYKMRTTPVTRPKLSLNITAATNKPRPALTISTTPIVQTPVVFHSIVSMAPPQPASPTTYNTRMNQYGLTAPPQSMTWYEASGGGNGILKKVARISSTPSVNSVSPANGDVSSCHKRIRFAGETQIHVVTPIENKDEYYGTFRKLSREERWCVQRS